MKECPVQGFVGISCRKDRGEGVESCFNRQTIRREYPEVDNSSLNSPSSVRSFIKKIANCPHRSDNLRYLEKKESRDTF